MERLVVDGTSWAEKDMEVFVSNQWVCWTAAVLYLPLLWLSSSLMSPRRPLPIIPLLVAWNFFLSALSLFMFAAALPYTIHLLSTHSFLAGICLNRGYGLDPWASLSFKIMAWSKLLELFDTFLLVFRKKPVILLHWYHHLTVLVYTWYAQVLTQTNAHVYFSMMNYFVHILMVS